MMTPQALAIPSCRILVVDEINGTRVETNSPQTADQALKNHGAVELANDWIRWYGDDSVRIDGTYPDRPIACSIQKTENLIVVRWHVIGDEEAARQAMQRVLDGTWWREEGELL